MGYFDEYNLAKKKQEELFRGDEKRQEEWQPIDLFHQDYEGDIERELRYKEQNKGLGENVEDEAQSLSYVEETIRLKEAGSTFEERTKYYFKDTKYMEAKEARYLSLAEDGDGNVAAFAQKHKNRSAGKRKKSAKAAAQGFKKVKKLEESFAEAGGDTLPAEDVYESRNEIMRARLNAMISAAKVKSTSKQDENYRIAKAKLSCLSTLYEQSEHLREAKSEYFDKVQADLKKEIESAKKDIKKYGQDPNARWLESLGCNDTKSLEKDLRESENPNATIEDVKLSRMFESMSLEARRPEYEKAQKIADEKNILNGKSTVRRDEFIAPTYIIRRDKQGNPINKEEQRKEAWNKKWLDACMDPKKAFERKKMLIESFERFKKLDIPTPQQIKEKGIDKIIMEDPVKIYQMNNYFLRFDNIRHIDPIVNEYCEFDKEFRAKLEIGENLSMMIVKHLNFNRNISQKNYKLLKGNKFEEMDDDEIEKKKEEERNEIQSHIEGFAKDYQPLETAVNESRKFRDEVRFNKPMSYDEAKKRAVEKSADDVFNEKSYELYKTVKNTNQNMNNPAYREKYAPVHKKLGGNNDISRIAGAMLREVKFDENWLPVSAEDMAAHEWNMKYLNNLKTYVAGPELSIHDKESLEKANKLLEEKMITQEDYEKRGIVQTLKKKKDDSAKVLEEMVREEFMKCYSEDFFALPTPEQMMKEVVEPLKGDGPIPEIPLLENMLKDAGKFTIFCQKTLSFEGTYKKLPFARELVKNECPWLDKYQDACTSIPLIAEFYFSHKYGVNPATGENATIEKISIDKTNIPFLVDSYTKFYNAYKESLKKKS